MIIRGIFGSLYIISGETPPPLIYYNNEEGEKTTKSNPPESKEYAMGMGMTYADSRKLVAHKCKLDALAWSAVVALPKGISDAQRQEALAWLQQYNTDDRPRVRPRRKSD